MKKLLLILLCLPLFIFSQEERKYERTMSVSQFAKELKEAAEKDSSYTLENCEITYDPLLDKEYVLKNTGDKEFEHDAVIKDIHFNENTFILINNCKFGKRVSGYVPTFTFTECSFGTLVLDSINTNTFKLSNINAEWVDLMHSRNLRFEVASSRISALGCTSGRSIVVQKNDIDVGSFNGNIGQILILENNIDHLGIAHSNKTLIDVAVIENNIISSDYNNLFGKRRLRLFLYDKNKLGIGSHSQYEGINIGTYAGNQNSWMSLGFASKCNAIYISNNKFKNNYKKVFSKKDSLSQQLNNTRYLRTSISPEAIKRINKNNYIVDSLWNKKQKNDFVLQQIQENDSLEIHLVPFNFSGDEESLKEIITNHCDININGIEIGKLSLVDNTLDICNISENRFTKGLTIQNVNADSLFVMKKNVFPDNNAVSIDHSVIDQFGFYFKTKKIYTNQVFNIKDTNILNSEFVSRLSEITPQLRQFINVFKAQGSSLKNRTILELKNLETNIYMLKYYMEPTINNWFHWKGFEFLKWYSDYGMNPFKALTYCFWAMLYFALFYFFFYSDWDKIDRGFLIKRFNSVMDYFTTEKRIQDFYSSAHDKEMTTFTDFKETLDKNKVHMPSMLASLARPIYQISLLRYKLLNFSYKKAEFMAGRKWVDLEKKDRYLIGILTFFLTLTYIIYLIFIRALNSIVLSINAFSTLGFGQIPVRGFTKYVAIIEGFIGWFLLSVFIVSLLSQMMSV